MIFLLQQLLEATQTQAQRILGDNLNCQFNVPSLYYVSL